MTNATKEDIEQLSQLMAKETLYELSYILMTGSVILLVLKAVAWSTLFVVLAFVLLAFAILAKGKKK